MKTIKKILNSAKILLLFSPMLTFADTTSGSNPTIPNPIASSGNNLIDVLKSLLTNVVEPVAAVAVVVWIIWAGFGFVTAQGNPSKIDKAKSRLLWSLVGAGVLLGAVGISDVVVNTVNALK